MKLYIANPTRQIVEFQYRIPEVMGVRSQRVGIGGQILIAGDLDSLTIQNIIDQHRKYGLVEASEVKNAQSFINTIFSVDKPVSSLLISYAMERNRTVLVTRGKKQRELAAISANNVIEDQLAESQLANLEKMEVTIEEVERVRASDEDTGPSVNEALRVSRSNIPDAPLSERRAAAQQQQGNKGKGKGKKNKQVVG